MSYDKLAAIAQLIHNYLPSIKSIGSFARITDIIEQCRRLDAAGIHYSFFYLVSISGAGCGEIGAKLTAAICNQTQPTLIGANMLTIYPDSELYTEIQRGNCREESELEKYKEVRTLIENLQIPTIFAAIGASNAYQFYGQLPKDKKKLLAFLDEIIENVSEEGLQRYRKSNFIITKSYLSCGKKIRRKTNALKMQIISPVLVKPIHLFLTFI